MKKNDKNANFSCFFGFETKLKTIKQYYCEIGSFENFSKPCFQTEAVTGVEDGDDLSPTFDVTKVGVVNENPDVDRAELTVGVGE